MTAHNRLDIGSLFLYSKEEEKRTCANITARQAARKRVDFPPMFGPVNSRVRGWWPFVPSPSIISFGTGTPFSLRANGCHNPLIFSIGPLLFWQTVLEVDCGRIEGRHIDPLESIAMAENDLSTSMQHRANITWDHWLAFSTNNSIKIESVSASASVASWSWTIW